MSFSIDNPDMSSTDQSTQTPDEEQEDVDVESLSTTESDSKAPNGRPDGVFSTL